MTKKRPQAAFFSAAIHECDPGCRTCGGIILDRFDRHVVDSTIIQLIAKCMNWAKHSHQKAAAKMHLDLDLNFFLPNFAIVNRAKDSD